MAGQNLKKPRRSRTLPSADVLPPPPNNPLRSVGRPVGDRHSGHLESVRPRPTDREPPFAMSLCEQFAGRGLCVNHQPDHIPSYQHKAQLATFLTRMKLQAAWSVIDHYGVLPADQIATELDFELAEGFDPLEGMDRPGGVIYWRIRQRAKELGLWHA